MESARLNQVLVEFDLQLISLGTKVVCVCVCVCVWISTSVSPLDLDLPLS